MGGACDINRVIAAWSVLTYCGREKTDGEAVSACVYGRNPDKGSDQIVVEGIVVVVKVPEKGIDGSWIDPSVKIATPV